MQNMFCFYQRATVHHGTSTAGDKLKVGTSAFSLFWKEKRARKSYECFLIHHTCLDVSLGWGPLH